MFDNLHSNFHLKCLKQDNFENWKRKLFNKREFRETDRVCERHFEKNQILTHWDHIIDGKLCQLEREKPKIKFDAVPHLNLPETETVLATINKKRGLKPKMEQRKRKQTIKYDRNEKVKIFIMNDLLLKFISNLFD